MHASLRRGRASTSQAKGLARRGRYKSRVPISFYRDAVIGELPRKPAAIRQPGRRSSGYYAGSAITVSVSGFISFHPRVTTILAAASELLSPLPFARRRTISG